MTNPPTTTRPPLPAEAIGGEPAAAGPATVRLYVDGPNLRHAIEASGTVADAWSVDLVALFAAGLRRHLGTDVAVEKLLYFSTAPKRQEKEHAGFVAAMDRRHPCFRHVAGRYATREWTGTVKGRGAEEVTVEIPVEKRTDVNLAVKMVHDAHRNRTPGSKRFDWACLVSCDADFTSALCASQLVGQPTLLLSLTGAQVACDLVGALLNGGDHVQVNRRSMRAHLLPAAGRPAATAQAKATTTGPWPGHLHPLAGNAA